MLMHHQTEATFLNSPLPSSSILDRNEVREPNKEDEHASNTMTQYYQGDSLSSGKLLKATHMLDLPWILSPHSHCASRESG